MRSRAVFLSLFGLLTVFIVAPHFVHASLPFFGPIIPDAHNACPANFPLLIQVVNNVIQLLLTLVIIVVSPIMIAYAGFIYVTKGSSEGDRRKANNVLLNIVIGIVVVCAAWLLIDALLATLTSQGLKSWSVLVLNNGNGESDCLAQAGTSETSLTSGYSSLAVSTTGGGTPGGTCTPLTSGPCSVTSLTPYFGNNATVASEACSVESGGIATHVSSTDILAGGQPYSIGLFQFNITNSFDSVPVPGAGGQACSNAFTAPCQNSGGYHNVDASGKCSSSIKTGQCGSITCTQLYQACVTAAENANTNIQQAVLLSNGGSNWGRWLNTANRCSLPH